MRIAGPAIGADPRMTVPWHAPFRTERPDTIETFHANARKPAPAIKLLHAGNGR